MLIEQNNPTGSRSVKQNQSILRRSVRAISSVLTFFLKSPIGIILFIWNLIAQTLTHIYRRIRSLIGTAGRKIQKFFTRKNSINTLPKSKYSAVEQEEITKANVQKAINLWNETSISSEFKVEVVNIARIIKTLEFAVVNWLLVSRREGVPLRVFFDNIASIDKRNFPDKSDIKFDAIIKSLTSEHGKKELQRLSIGIQPSINLSLNEAKNNTIRILDCLLCLENDIHKFAKQHLPNITRAERLRIIQSGLIANDNSNLRPSGLSCIIGKSLDYCFGDA